MHKEPGFWEGLNTVVTGHAGLIGQSLTKELVQLGADVTGFDLKKHDNIMNYSAVLKAVTGADSVFHLAAQSMVDTARSDPYEAWRVNVMGTLNVIEACREAKVKSIAVATSNHVYGVNRGRVAEDANLNDLDTYSATKIAVDYMSRSYSHVYGTPIVVIRNTNCFAAHDPHQRHIVPYSIGCFLEGVQPTLTSDGTTKKSYLHSEDVAGAYLAASQYVIEHPRSHHVFNVSDEPISTIDLVRTIAEVMQVKADPVIGLTHVGHDEELDSTLIRKVVGWKPKYTLRQAIAVTADKMALMR